MSLIRLHPLFWVGLLVLGASCGSGGDAPPPVASVWIENGATFHKTDGILTCLDGDPHTLTLVGAVYWVDYWFEDGEPRHDLDIPRLAPGERILVREWQVQDPDEATGYHFTGTWSDGITGAGVCINGAVPFRGEVKFTRPGDVVITLRPGSR